VQKLLKSKIKDGVTYVSAARLVEVSLVTEPAFKSAQVTDIAAEEAEKVEEAASETQPTRKRDSSGRNHSSRSNTISRSCGCRGCSSYCYSNGLHKATH